MVETAQTQARGLGTPRAWAKSEVAASRSSAATDRGGGHSILCGTCNTVCPTWMAGRKYEAVLCGCSACWERWSCSGLFLPRQRLLKANSRRRFTGQGRYPAGLRLGSTGSRALQSRFVLPSTSRAMSYRARTPARNRASGAVPMSKAPNYRSMMIKVAASPVRWDRCVQRSLDLSEKSSPRRILRGALVRGQPPRWGWISKRSRARQRPCALPSANTARS